MVAEPLGLLWLCFCCGLVSLDWGSLWERWRWRQDCCGERVAEPWWSTSSRGSGEPLSQLTPRSSSFRPAFRASGGGAAAEGTCRETQLLLEPTEIRAASQGRGWGNPGPALCWQQGKRRVSISHGCSNASQGLSELSNFKQQKMILQFCF